MQYGQFYNLHRRAYFSCVLFIFKNSKTVYNQFLRLQKLIALNFTFFETKTAQLK